MPLFLLALIIATITIVFSPTVDLSNLHFGLGAPGFGRFEERDSIEGVDMDDGSVSGPYVTIMKGIRLGRVRIFVAEGEEEANPTKP